MPMSVEWHREYQRKRCHERLALARKRLGGRCVRCGSTENLDFDHIVPGSRVRKISEATNWSLARFLAEVDKCQLLCRTCHQEKSGETGEDGSVEHGGGKKGKRNCPCTLCKTKRREYNTTLRRRIRGGGVI